MIRFPFDYFDDERKDKVITIVGLIGSLSLLLYVVMGVRI